MVRSRHGIIGEKAKGRPYLVAGIPIALEGTSRGLVLDKLEKFHDECCVQAKTGMRKREVLRPERTTTQECFDEM